jgi:hypothetical protein
LARVADPDTRDRVRQHAVAYSLDRTADGFEEAAFATSRRRIAEVSPLTARPS